MAGPHPRIRATYSAHDTWALIELINRVPDRYHLDLNHGDLLDLVRILDQIKELDYSHQGHWASRFRTRVLDHRENYYQRGAIINLIGILWCITWQHSFSQGFTGPMQVFAERLLADIAESLDIELV